MRYTHYLIFAFILSLFVNCSSDDNKETPGILSGASLLSFSVLYDGDYYPAAQVSESVWNVGLPVSARDTAFHAMCELAEGISIAPNPAIQTKYPAKFTLSDLNGNTLDVTVNVTRDQPFYGIWLSDNGNDYYPTRLPNGERLIVLPAEATTPALDYETEEGGAISPLPDLGEWPENTPKAFTITDAQGSATKITYRWVRNNYFTMIVLGDPEYDMRGFSADGSEVKAYIQKIIDLKNDASLYFEPVSGLRVDYGPEIVLCLGDIDKDANQSMDGFMSVFGPLYDNGIPFVTVFGNHDWSSYNYWDTADNGFTLILDAGNYGYTRGEQAQQERTIALCDRSLSESEPFGVTVDRKFLSADFGHNYEGEVSPFVFSFRGVRFYCGQTYWFQQWYTPSAWALSRPTFHCTDEIMTELERLIDGGWGEAPAVWIQHYPMSDTQTDGGSKMWWHDRQGFNVASSNDPNANQGVKWPTYEDKVAQMMNVIGKTKNPVFFAGHTHNVARHQHSDPDFSEYVTPYFHDGGVYVVLMKEGEGVVSIEGVPQVIQYKL